MTQIIQRRVVIALKILTVISFLCIIIDNGKFELPMALTLLSPLVYLGSLVQAPDVATILYSIMFILYGFLLYASLMCLFISAVTPYFSKKATIASIVAIFILWLQVGLAASTSFANPSYRVVLTHAIFAILSLATLISIGLFFKKGKVSKV